MGIAAKRKLEAELKLQALPKVLYVCVCAGYTLCALSIQVEEWLGGGALFFFL